MSSGQPPSVWLGKLRPGGGRGLCWVTERAAGPAIRRTFTSPRFSFGGFCFSSWGFREVAERRSASTGMGIRHPEF